MKTVGYVLFVCTGIFALVVISAVVFDDVRLMLSPWSDTETGSPDTSELQQQVDILKKQVDQLYDDRPAKRIINFPSALRKKFDDIAIFERTDLFGSYVLDLPFTSYESDGVVWYVFEHNYTTVYNHFSSLGSIFVLNETHTFYGKSFFLNAKKPDGYVRVIFEFQGKIIWFQVKNQDYLRVKDLLS